MGIKSVVYRVTSREDLLVRRPKSVKTIDSTGQCDISIAFYFSSFFQLVSLLFLVYKPIRTMCKLLFVCMCVWPCSSFRITDTLLPIDLSILI